MKGYNVFNADQVEGLPQHFSATEAEPGNGQRKQRIEAADRFFANLGADIRHGGNRAFYHLAGDFIQLPVFDAFISAETHAGTADLGVAIEPREDHAAYIASWLKCLKNEKRAVFQMAAHAERAVAYLHGLQPGSNVAIATEGNPAAA
ncbi:zincin-like metallopeptidase domain-containing protein [Sinorhizobium fredii]|uniref:zincin-like metallopeptidase domain-containing protein n=1 Tax=Rhizobium fredii TaxID=380 RepID=UPI00351689F2